MRKLLVVCRLAGILSGICSMFWYHEWKYSLPTPVPADYKDVRVGQHLNLRNKIVSAPDKPLFIHFFNPDCPCSRFNIPHFNSLVKKYGDKMTFVVVVINKDKDYTAKEIKDKYDSDCTCTLPIQNHQPANAVYTPLLRQ
jgi:thiol-disulfide isomerase/thioredoxin